MANAQPSGEDAAWLHMETDDNLMVVCGFLELATPLELPRLEALLRERLLVIDRFTHRGSTLTNLDPGPLARIREVGQSTGERGVTRRHGLQV